MRRGGSHLRTVYWREGGVGLEMVRRPSPVNVTDWKGRGVVKRRGGDQIIIGGRREWES